MTKNGFSKREEELLDINNIISYMEKTDEDSWYMKVCRTKGGENCLFGHLFDYGGGDNGKGSFICDWFEEMYATVYMFFSINDGEHPDYPQKTPKQRIVAYLKDLRDGKQQTTQQLMDEYLT